MGSDLRGADHEEHLVVLMGGGGAPVEAAGDDGLAVDDSELVVLGSRSAVPAWFLRVAEAL